MQRGDPAGVRLELGELLRPDPPQALDAVCAAARLELVETGDLRLVERDDHLAAALVRDPVLVAERVHPAHPVDAELRLERARLVIDPGVQHAGVVPGLMARDLALTLEQRDAQARTALQELARERESDDPAADHREIAVIGSGGAHHAL